jgi:hypothetical protein
VVHTIATAPTGAFGQIERYRRHGADGLVGERAERGRDVTDEFEDEDRGVTREVVHVESGTSRLLHGHPRVVHASSQSWRGRRCQRSRSDRRLAVDSGGHVSYGRS